VKPERSKTRLILVRLISQEEIPRNLGIDIKKSEFAITHVDHEREGMHACLHFWRNGSALHKFMHLPGFDYHPEKELP
jgi:hypothetical protein